MQKHTQVKLVQLGPLSPVFAAAMFLNRCSRVISRKEVAAYLLGSKFMSLHSTMIEDDERRHTRTTRSRRKQTEDSPNNRTDKRSNATSAGNATGLAPSAPQARADSGSASSESSQDRLIAQKREEQQDQKLIKMLARHPLISALKGCPRFIRTAAHSAERNSLREWRRILTDVQSRRNFALSIDPATGIYHNGEEDNSQHDDEEQEQGQHRHTHHDREQPPTNHSRSRRRSGNQSQWLTATSMRNNRNGWGSRLSRESSQTNTTITGNNTDQTVSPNSSPQARISTIRHHHNHQQQQFTPRHSTQHFSYHQPQHPQQQQQPGLGGDEGDDDDEFETSKNFRAGVFMQKRLSKRKELKKRERRLSSKVRDTHQHAHMQHHINISQHPTHSMSSHHLLADPSKNFHRVGSEPVLGGRAAAAATSKASARVLASARALDHSRHHKHSQSHRRVDSSHLNQHGHGHGRDAGSRSDPKRLGDDAHRKAKIRIAQLQMKIYKLEDELAELQRDQQFAATHGFGTDSYGMAGSDVTMMSERDRDERDDNIPHHPPSNQYAVSDKTHNLVSELKRFRHKLSRANEKLVRQQARTSNPKRRGNKGSGKKKKSSANNYNDAF